MNFWNLLTVALIGSVIGFRGGVMTTYCEIEELGIYVKGSTKKGAENRARATFRQYMRSGRFPTDKRYGLQSHTPNEFGGFPRVTLQQIWVKGDDITTSFREWGKAFSENLMILMGQNPSRLRNTYEKFIDYIICNTLGRM